MAPTVPIVSVNLRCVALRAVWATAAASVAGIQRREKFMTGLTACEADGARLPCSCHGYPLREAGAQRGQGTRPVQILHPKLTMVSLASSGAIAPLPQFVVSAWNRPAWLRAAPSAWPSLLSLSLIGGVGFGQQPCPCGRRRERPRAARGAGHGSLVPGIHHQADDHLCRPRHGAPGPACDGSAPHRDRGAAALPPSKMAFKPGTQVRLDNALKIIMVKSANDIAATIAENLGGSIDGFAEHDERRRPRLGMRESHFVNPHGLPDDRQQTSARDMAILARALLREFPTRRTCSISAPSSSAAAIMRNTNGLIGRYPGADGMKTGFICAAGFNVVAERDPGAAAGSSPSCSARPPRTSGP